MYNIVHDQRETWKDAFHLADGMEGTAFLQTSSPASRDGPEAAHSRVAAVAGEHKIKDLESIHHKEAKTQNDGRTQSGNPSRTC